MQVEHSFANIPTPASSLARAVDKLVEERNRRVRETQLGRVPIADFDEFNPMRLYLRARQQRMREASLSAETTDAQAREKQLVVFRISGAHCRRAPEIEAGSFAAEMISREPEQPFKSLRTSSFAQPPT
jgi:hypothetical protein